MIDRYNTKNPIVGTLYLTATHLIFVEPETNKETWVSSPLLLRSLVINEFVCYYPWQCFYYWFMLVLLSFSIEIILSFWRRLNLSIFVHCF